VAGTVHRPWPAPAGATLCVLPQGPQTIPYVTGKPGDPPVMSPTNVLIVLLLLWPRVSRVTGSIGPAPGRTASHAGGRGTPSVRHQLFDTLGIGSFATTTTIYRLFRRVDDSTFPAR
jgi:hypothetical protein